MKKSIKYFIILSMIIDTFFLFGGTFLLLYKDYHLTYICYGLGFISSIYSILLLIIMKKTPYFLSFVPTTTTSLIFSVAYFFNPSKDYLFLPIFCCVWMFVCGALTLQVGLDIKYIGNKWLSKLIIVNSIITFIVSILSISSQLFMGVTAYKQLGIFIIIFSINQLINLYQFYLYSDKLALFSIKRLSS